MRTAIASSAARFSVVVHVQGESGCFSVANDRFRRLDKRFFMQLPLASLVPHESLFHAVKEEDQGDTTPGNR